MENLRGVKIVNKDSLMVENSHLYIKAKDENYCELTILDENGKKRNVGATWSSIIDKPTLFPPSTHTHSENEIKIIVGTSFASVGQYQSQFNQAVENWKGSIQTQIDNKANLSDVYKKNQTFSQTEVTNLLNNKQDVLTFTPENAANKSNSYTASSSTTYASSKALVDGLSTKQKKLSSFDESILIETDGNIEGNVSLFQEYFEQQICELNFTPIQIIGVYINGIKQKPSSYTVTLPKKITVANFTSGDYIEIQYTKLKI